MIVNKSERKLKKGTGYHLDMFLIGLFAIMCGGLGLPMLCAATGRFYCRWVVEKKVFLSNSCCCESSFLDRAIVSCQNKWDVFVFVVCAA